MGHQSGDVTLHGHFAAIVPHGEGVEGRGEVTLEHDECVNVQGQLEKMDVVFHDELEQLESDIGGMTVKVEDLTSRLRISG